MNESSTVEFLLRLRSLNVTLSAEGVRLRCSAPAEVMTRDLQKELAIRKAELLSFLKDASLATRPQPKTVKRVPHGEELPLSFAQMRLWLLDQLEPGTATYSIPSCFRLKGKFNLAAFEQSVTEIVRRHEALRTRFLMVNGQPVQKIAAPEPFQISVVDLQALPKAAREEEAARFAKVDARQPFDLGKAPLMRATLLKLAAEEQVLLLNVHHITFDGWSFGVFERELSELYENFLQGEVSRLPELPIQYADFAAWQRKWLQGEVLQAQLDYWKEKLSGSLEVLELPTDRPRPGLQTYNGSTVSLVFSPELTEGLKSLSQRERVTLFVTLLAAFNVLLLHYSGQEDLLVGTPIANRNRAELEGLIGFFVNTLVMRSDLSGNPTFRELLGRVQETALEAYAHQDLPFEKLVEELNPQRDMSRSPIFQVLFSFLNTPMLPLKLLGLETSRMKAYSGTSKFDLSLYAIEIPEGLRCTFEYNTDLFNADRIERMLGHFETLLGGILCNPEQRLFELPLLTRREREQTFMEWNDTQVDYPAHACIHELFEAQVEGAPEAVALTCESISLTYAELNQRANALARYLQALGVGSEVLVAVCMKRTVEMVVGLLAVLKAGGAYVPLDPAYPPERLAFILEETQVPVVLTQRSITGLLPSCEARVVCLDDANLQAEIQTLARDDFRGASAPQNPASLAYVLYTSGSTGKPKGVEITHRSVVNFLNSMREVPGMAAQDTLLSVTTLSFDIFGLELWLPLSTGARVVIAPEDVARDGRELGALIGRSGATVMQATPSTWRLLLESGWEGDSQLKILCGGEAWSPQLAEQLLPKCGSLWNMYGPTETTIWSAVHPVEKGKPIVIGRPIANTQFYVADAHLQPVPVGVPGELLIGGEGLARGYLKRAELTAEKFIAAPFNPQAGSRLYRTGDLVRYLADGTLEFLGRIDHQVKIRGFRIELGEIEEALRQHPGLHEAVVTVREDTAGDKRLVAYYTAAGTEEQGGTVDQAEALRKHLARSLPEYMVPAAYVKLAALPLTPNGKLERKALPAPDTARPTMRVYEAPQGEVETILAGIWADILKVERVGRHDNFFELGGHSLLAMRLISKVQELLNCKLSVLVFFQNPTIESMVRVLQEGMPGGLKEGKGSLRVVLSQGTKSLAIVPEDARLVALQKAEGRPSFFIVDSYPYFIDVVKLLGSDQPVMSLVAHASSGYSIAKEAAAHVQTILEFQPNGPYMLGGCSAPGIVAYEVARQLQEGGHQVGLLVLFDTPNPYFTRQYSALHSSLAYHKAALKRMSWAEIPPYIAAKFAGVAARTWDALGGALPGGQGPTSSPDEFGYASQLELISTRITASRKYRPQPYTGRLLLFKVRPTLGGRYLDARLGWGETVRGKIEVCQIGTRAHIELFKSELDRALIAQKLRCSFDEVVATVSADDFGFTVNSERRVG